MRWFLIGLCLVAAACSGEKQVSGPAFFEKEDPPSLSAWGVIRAANGTLVLGEGVVPYTLNTPLFTDYADKLRTIWMPAGTANTLDDGRLDFPVGTVISKTFYYPSDDRTVLKRKKRQPVNQTRGLSLDAHRLIETRLLVRRNSGWHALVYVWNEEESEAHLKKIGDIKKLELMADTSERVSFNYIVPNTNQCASCHTAEGKARGVQPLGPKLPQLDRSYEYADGQKNQLHKLASVGYMSAAGSPTDRMAVWDDPLQPLENRARAYIAANCGHCHNPKGTADTSGLYLNIENSDRLRLGTCKPTIAAGSGTGGHRFGIVPGRPEESIFVFRMRSTDPAAMMPELGRSLAHNEGVALIADWIAQMSGDCGPA